MYNKITFLCTIWLLSAEYSTGKSFLALNYNWLEEKSLYLGTYHECIYVPIHLSKSIIIYFFAARYIELFKSTVEEANMEARGKGRDDFSSSGSFGRGGPMRRGGAGGQRGFPQNRAGPYDRPMGLFGRGGGGMGGGMGGGRVINYLILLIKCFSLI